MAKVCDLTGKHVGSGHNVSHSNRKIPRRFIPNLVDVRLNSELLSRRFKFRIAASTLRTIDYFGGLDAYLLRTKNGKLTDMARKIKKKLASPGS